MFNFLRKFFKRKPAPEKPRLVLPVHAPPPAPKPEPAAPPSAREEWSRQAAHRIDPNATPEDLCGLTAEMTEEQVSAQLAMLYRRHNRAASSLEANLREEAEIMLDVIAAMRQKYLK
jgi:hypothetical protein